MFSGFFRARSNPRPLRSSHHRNLDINLHCHHQTNTLSLACFIGFANITGDIHVVPSANYVELQPWFLFRSLLSSSSSLAGVATFTIHDQQKLGTDLVALKDDSPPPNKGLTVIRGGVNRSRASRPPPHPTTTTTPTYAVGHLRLGLRLALCPPHPNPTHPHVPSAICDDLLAHAHATLLMRVVDVVSNRFQEKSEPNPNHF